jgi:hypothetical protein
MLPAEGIVAAFDLQNVGRFRQQLQRTLSPFKGNT